MNLSVFRLLVLTLSTLILNNCASLSQGQCLSGDWYGIGFRDGRDGADLDRLGNHHEACAQYGIQVNSYQYRDGYNKGIREYCTPDNGLREGKQGNYYHNVCPPELAQAFERNYRLGKSYYEIKQQIDDIDYDIDDKEEKLDKKGDKMSKSERRILETEIRSLYRERRSLFRALSALGI